MRKIRIDLTRPQLEAVCEALGSRLAGPIEKDCQPRAVYDRAFDVCAAAMSLADLRDLTKKP